MVDNFTEEEKEQRKKAIFDSMGKRGQQRILKRGYDEWDPFEEPKDPIDIRKDGTKRTIDELMREFYQYIGNNDYSNAYGQGVQEIALGLMAKNERFKGMFEFSIWYSDLLKKEGVELD